MKVIHSYASPAILTAVTFGLEGESGIFLTCLQLEQMKRVAVSTEVAVQVLCVYIEGIMLQCQPDCSVVKFQVQMM